MQFRKQYHIRSIISQYFPFVHRQSADFPFFSIKKKYILGILHTTVAFFAGLCYTYCIKILCEDALSQRVCIMANQKDVAFRTALSGYKREDVNAYIIDLNRDFEAREADLHAQLAAAEARLAEADTALAAAKEDASAANKAKEEAEAVLGALRESNDNRKEENARLTEQIALLQSQVDAYAAKLAEAEKAPAQDPESDDIKKSLKYDQISAQIGDILINANTSADRIIASANAEATRIMTETENEATYIHSRLSDAADSMLSQISTELHTSTDHCVSELLTVLREMRDSTSSLLADFENRNRDLKEKVAYYQTSVTETIRRALTEMDQKYGIRVPSRKD